MASRGTGPGHGRVLGGQGGGSAAALPRRRLWAKCAFEQRFLAHSPSRPGSARPRPGVPPLAPGSPLDAADRGHSPPLRCPGFGEGSPAVTNPQKRPRFLTRSFATGRGLNFWGLVTAHSRAPRQRSRPTREPSLGLGLTSALPRGRSVGLSVARHIVLGRWRRARSRRIEGST